MRPLAGLVAAALLLAGGVARAESPAPGDEMSPVCPEELLSLAPCAPGEDACATLIEDLDLLLVVGGETRMNDSEDCALPVVLAGLDCEDPSSATTPWLAGILGLCDAPFGLGRIGASRPLRVARVPAHPARTPLPGSAETWRLELPATGASAPTSPSDSRAPGPEPALVQPARDPMPPTSAGLLRAAPLAGALPPGHVRRIDRPPRA